VLAQMNMGPVTVVAEPVYAAQGQEEHEST
jgi:hypothetical protein